MKITAINLSSYLQIKRGNISIKIMRLERQNESIRGNELN